MKNSKYVGADVHQSTTSFCVRDADGRVVMETVAETQSSTLVSLIKGLRGVVHLTFEEGTQAAWLYDLLRPYVAELVVCDPRKNRLIEEGNKSDRIDARKLSELLWIGRLKPVYHGEHGTRLLKELARGYQQLVEDTVRVKNRIKARYRSRGIAVSGAGVYQRDQRTEWLEKLGKSGLRVRTQWLYEQLDKVQELRKEAEKAMLTESRKHRGVRLVRSVPGIGAIRAAQIVSQVDTPHRFRTKRQFWSYVGLAVVTHTSADFEVVDGGLRRRTRVTTRGLNPGCHRLLKAIFKGAAIEAIQGDLREYYESRVKSGMRPEMARLTVARKIAAICLAAWKKGERYSSDKALKRVA